MKQRGRQSSGNPRVIPIASAMRRIDPPDDLTPSERTLLHQITASCPPGHFVQSDVFLLVNFVRATLLSRRAAEALAANPTDTAALGVWERACRMQAMLALKLRLAPSARTDPQVTARAQAAHSASAYDMMEHDDAS